VFTTDTLPGFILGFREGLEAFLMIGIILDYLKKAGEHRFVRPVQWGLFLGVLGSIALGLVLWALTTWLGTQGGDQTGKLWAAGASLAGLVLLSTFLYWMMKHGRTVYQEVHAEIQAHFSASGLFLISLVMVLREGAEISLFAFSSSNQMAYVTGIVLGVLAAAVLAWAITKALIRVNLKVLFTVTLGYLVLQAGYLLGYGVHEFLSALKGLGLLTQDSLLLVKAWNVQGVWEHKEGLIGLPLNVLVGWYSRPEWLQFVLQVGYILAMGALWRTVLKRSTP